MKTQISTTVSHRKWRDMAWTIDGVDVPPPHPGDAWHCDVIVHEARAVGVHTNHNFCVVMPKQYEGYFPTEYMVRHKDNQRHHARKILEIVRTLKG